MEPWMQSVLDSFSNMAPEHRNALIGGLGGAALGGVGGALMGGKNNRWMGALAGAGLGGGLGGGLGYVSPQLLEQFQKLQAGDKKPKGSGGGGGGTGETPGAASGGVPEAGPVRDTSKPPANSWGNFLGMTGLGALGGGAAGGLTERVRQDRHLQKLTAEHVNQRGTPGAVERMGLTDPHLEVPVPLTQAGLHDLPNPNHPLGPLGHQQALNAWAEHNPAGPLPREVPHPTPGGIPLNIEHMHEPLFNRGSDMLKMRAQARSQAANRSVGRTAGYGSAGGAAGGAVASMAIPWLIDRFSRK